MPQLHALAQGRVELVFLQQQPDDTVARFDYETHLGALTSPTPCWPENTKGISQLRLTLRIRPEGFLGGLLGTVLQHIDIIDYPGEWLLDLTLLEKSYEEWSASALANVDMRDIGADYATLLAQTDGSAAFSNKTQRH